MPGAMPFVRHFAPANWCCCMPGLHGRSKKGALHDSLIPAQHCSAEGAPEPAASPDTQPPASSASSCQRLMPAGASSSCPDLQQLEQEHQQRDVNPLKRPSSPGKGSSSSNRQSKAAGRPQRTQSTSDSIKAVDSQGIELKPAEKNPYLGVEHLTADRSFVKARPGM